MSAVRERFSSMDILAARKRAAEQAKAARETRDAAPIIVPEPERRDQPAVSSVPELQDAGPAVDDRTPGPVQSAPAVQERSDDVLDTPEEGSEQEQEMLAFLLGTEEYVVPVDQVQEVLKPREITPVPHTPDYLLGVCSLRGTVLPVVDLARRLGFAPGTRDDKSRIIVTGSDADDRIGLLVDRVRSVVRFPASAVRPVPDTVEQGVEFLRGIARRDQRLFILLDVEKAAIVGDQKLHKKVVH